MVLLAVWLYAGVMITRASLNLRKVRSTDEYLAAAYKKTFWGAFAIWTLVALCIAGFLLLFVTGVGEIGLAVSFAGAGFLVTDLLVLALLLTSGGLAIYAALQTQKSGARDELVVKAAYQQLKAAAIACVSAAALVVLGVLIIFFYTHSKQRKTSA